MTIAEMAPIKMREFRRIPTTAVALADGRFLRDAGHAAKRGFAACSYRRGGGGALASASQRVLRMDDDILHEFLVESWEHLSRLEAEFGELKTSPGDADLLASLFRTIHTIKGTCGCIGFRQLETVAHSTENVLGRVRNGDLPANPDSLALVLEAIDEIRTLLEGIEAIGEEPRRDNSPLLERLNRIAEVDAPIDSSVADPMPCDAQSPAAKNPSHESSGLGPLPGRAEEPNTIPQTCGPAERSIRVPVDLLDDLAKFAAELVEIRNQFLRLAQSNETANDTASVSRLSRVTNDLQDAVRRTRMQPVGKLCNKLPKLIRSLTEATGKPIEFEFSGCEMKLDYAVLAAIQDPLIHIIRNSADHGIEPPEERRRLGKPEEGKIRLHADQKNGRVTILIEDDGAGVDFEKVRRNALSAGLIRKADLGKLSEADLLQFLFAPGFSTVEAVSSLSGRGVGMDVVKTRIERIGGTVDLSSSRGVGLTVKIDVPRILGDISRAAAESDRESSALRQDGRIGIPNVPRQGRRTERIQSDVLRNSFERIAPRADQLARRFFDRLLARHPELQWLFRTTDWPDQHRRLIQALLVIVKSLDRPETLTRFLDELGRRHVKYGVAAAHYPVMIDALLEAFSETAGEDWSQSLEAAWRQTLEEIADVMVRASGPCTPDTGSGVYGTPRLW